jgi:hypothetical protein
VAGPNSETQNPTIDLQLFGFDGTDETGSAGPSGEAAAFTNTHGALATVLYDDSSRPAVTDSRILRSDPFRGGQTVLGGKRFLYNG